MVNRLNAVQRKKKLRQVEIDDLAELRVVYEKFVAVLTSLIQRVRSQLNNTGVPTLINFDSIPFLSGLSQMTLPSLGSSATFSLLSEIARGDVAELLTILRAYRLRILYELDEIPRKLRGVVVNGQHIFSFDGRHLTFPGSCRYVLAHDYVDRNFTLMIQLQNGLPKALILEDKSGTTIELKDNGQIALNGADHGYPITEKDVFAFKRLNGIIGFDSKYGVKVDCFLQLEVCYVEVNGFYLGKLRGLLGDGNNEPYEDFRLPNGKMTSSEAEFGNAYRLASSCQQVKTPEHSHHQLHTALPPECEQVFGSTSTLRPLSLLMDSAPFRQACIHAVASNPQHAHREACRLAVGYVVLGLAAKLPAFLPLVCLKCTDAGQLKSFADTYTLKLPKKQADILVLVETTKSSEKIYKDIVVQLVSQVVDNLKSKSITDIKMYLVGITSKFPYPIVYDTDLKLKNAKCAFDDESRYPSTKPIKTGCEKFDKFQEIFINYFDNFKIALGLTNVNEGYTMALAEAPFRPGAVKHIISAIGEQCHSEIGLPVMATSFEELNKENGPSETMVVITPDLKVSGGKDASQVVGFTNRSVYLLGDKNQTKDDVKVTLGQPDACAESVATAGGIILSATNFMKLDPGYQQQFLQTAANAITATMLHKQLVKQCMCTYDYPFSAHSVCHKKKRKKVARRQK